MVMDCGTCIIFIRFRIPDQVYCNKSKKNLLFKTFILQKINAPLLLHRLGTVLHSPFMRMLVFMLKEDRCKCEWKPPTKYARKYICLVSFLHIHTKYLDLQACKKLAHRGVKAFDDYYQCEREKNAFYKLWFIVNENNKICYTLQHITVQDVYIFTICYVHSMYLLVKVTCWNNGILNK